MKKREIHLWCTQDQAITDSALLQSYAGLLNKQEHEKQQRFYFPKDRHQYLVTRALLKTTLSRYAADTQPIDWRFAKNEFGKPFLDPSKHAQKLHFNLSHCENFIVLAICFEAPIGVDAEWKNRIDTSLELAEQFFSAAEVNALRELPPEQQRDRFFDLWTLKEAYIKAKGKGLSIPLNHFSYLFDNDGAVRIAFSQELLDIPERWRFWRFEPNLAHKIALALALKCESPNDYEVRMFEGIPLLHFESVEYESRGDKPAEKE